MVMVAATLGTELENNMTIVDNESDAIDNLAASWEAYFYDAAVGAVTATPGSLASATTAFKSAAIGISEINAAATKIQAAIIAFWGVVAGSAATIWVTVPPNTGATPPPTLSGIAAALQPVFTANMQAGLNLHDSCLAIANVLHTNNLGGICIIPPPGASTPIL